MNKLSHRASSRSSRCRRRRGTARAQVYPERIVAVEGAAWSSHARLPAAQRDDNREEQTERTTKTSSSAPTARSTLGNIAGDITVTAAAAPTRRSRSSRRRAAATPTTRSELLQLVQVDVDRARRPRRSQDALSERRRAAPQQPPQRQRQRRLHRHRAGRHARSPIESISGDVKVTDIKGDVSANSVSGDVRISGAGRVGAAKIDLRATSRSPTRRPTARSRRRASAATSSSAGSRARRIDGRLGQRQHQARGRPVRARRARTTISGNVGFSGTLARAAATSSSRISGDVRLVALRQHRLRGRRQLVLRRGPLRLRRSRRAATRAGRRGRRTDAAAAPTATAAPSSISRPSAATIVISKR